MATIPVDLRAQLVTLYSEPQRKYHTLQHIMHCVRELHDVENKGKESARLDLSLIELAIWFHDSVYDPRSTLNEVQSAQLATGYLNANAGLFPDTYSGEIWDMIYATKNHFDAKPGNINLDTFLDIDMSVLGQHEDAYDEYAAGIASEYSFVPKRMYFGRRIEVLQEMLDQPHIYRTKYFRDKYEVKARENVAFEIVTLKEGLSRLGNK